MNPETLEILDGLQLPEPATVPHIVAMYEGRIAIYIGVDSGCLRAFWDPATVICAAGITARSSA